MVSFVLLKQIAFKSHSLPGYTVAGSHHTELVLVCKDCKRTGCHVR